MSAGYRKRDTIPSPFEDDGFSFNPRDISVYSQPAPRGKRPGDVFGSDELQAKKGVLARSKAVGLYRSLKYVRNFRMRAVLLFLMFMAPGIIVAALLLLGII